MKEPERTKMERPYHLILSPFHHVDTMHCALIASKKIRLDWVWTFPCSILFWLVERLESQSVSQSVRKPLQTKMGDKLTEIDRKDLPLLKRLYDTDGTPKHYMGLMTIDNFMSQFAQDSDVEHVKFYCLNGDFSNGTFAVVVSF